MLARTEIVDTTLDLVIAEFRKEFGEDITKAEVFAIVQNEFAMIDHAMINREDIELPFFGKFHDNEQARIKAQSKYTTHGKLRTPTPLLEDAAYRLLT